MRDAISFADEVRYELEAKGQRQESNIAAVALRRAFLAHGTVADPARENHLAFTCPHVNDAQQLVDLLAEAGFSPRIRERQVYFKNAEGIADLLTFMGAANAAIRCMDEQILKSIRNQSNRATNCDTANIARAADSAARQLAAIAALRQRGDFAGLPDDVQNAAQLREEHPELSLGELSDMLDMSKSSLRRRLLKLCEMAEAL